MKKTVLLLSLFLLLPGMTLSAQQKKTVAVINFSNETGGEGLSYLSTSLSDSVTASLAANDRILTVERRQISAVIDEIKLDLSGMVSDESISRAGEITSADVIIIGSYTGNPEKITLTMKAINVETAEVIYARVISAGLGELFDVASREAYVFASVITGEDTGRVSVSTVPSGAEIYIDGTNTGKSPLVEYLLPAGSHRLKVVLKGYKEEERDFIIEAEKIRNIGISLIETIETYPWNFSLGAMLRKPLNSPSDSDLFRSSLEIPVSVSYTFDRLTVEGGYSFTKMDHSETIDSVFGDIEQTRWYNIHTFSISLLMSFFEELEYMRPYGGLFLGGSMISDNRENSSYDNDKENLDRFGRFVIGPKGGIVFFPDYKLKPYIEMLFYFYPEDVIRKSYTIPPLGGGLQESEDSFKFYGFSIGGGLKYSYRQR